MTTSDKVVLGVGIATCMTMLATGWMGEKAFAAISSSKAPMPTPEENANNKIERAAHRKLQIASGLLFAEGLAILVLSWHFNRNVPVTIETVVIVAFAFIAMLIGIALPPVVSFLDNMRIHILLTQSLCKSVDGQLEVMGSIVDVLKNPN